MNWVTAVKVLGPNHWTTRDWFPFFISYDNLFLLVHLYLIQLLEYLDLHLISYIFLFICLICDLAFPPFCIYLHILILFFLSVSTIVISFSTIFKCFPLRLKHVFTFFFKYVGLFFPNIRIVIMYTLQKVEKVKDGKSSLTSAHQPLSSPDDSEWVSPSTVIWPLHWPPDV